VELQDGGAGRGHGAHSVGGAGAAAEGPDLNGPFRGRRRFLAAVTACIVRACGRLAAFFFQGKIHVNTPALRVEPTLSNEPPALPPGPPQMPPGFGVTPPRRPVRFEFTGRAGEYFGIWIVNLVLTVLTLGIYSAWAKVRTERYFYAHTRLDGSPFEYLAKPITILKGRLIAYALVLGLTIGLKFQILWLAIPIYLVLLIAFPWLIWLSMRFRARYSSWRGLRFGFLGTVGESYVNFMLWPIVSVFTLNLLSPWVRMQQQQYMATSHRFGGFRFGFAGDAGDYYKPFLLALAAGFMVFIAFAILMAATAASLGRGGGDPPVAAFVPIALMYAAFLCIPIYLRIQYTNLMWRAARLDRHRFTSTLRARDMLWLYFSNGVAILCTVGLAVPWAMIRMARYRAEHMQMDAAGTLDQFVAEAGGSSGAAGAELVDALDLDLDLAL
jgi:uncharacterized membrane protein YjgN (DUF898 family)